MSGNEISLPDDIETDDTIDLLMLDTDEAIVNADDDEIDDAVLEEDVVEETATPELDETDIDDEIDISLISFDASLDYEDISGLDEDIVLVGVFRMGLSYKGMDVDLSDCVAVISLHVDGDFLEEQDAEGIVLKAVAGDEELGSVLFDGGADMEFVLDDISEGILLFAVTEDADELMLMGNGPVQVFLNRNRTVARPLFDGSAYDWFADYMEAEEDVLGREADPDTMDSYADVLFGKSGTSEYSSDELLQRAGLLWSDKSVFAKNYAGGSFNGQTLFLDMNSDGISAWKSGSGTGLDNVSDTAKIELPEGSDFLHVFSALGSTAQLESSTPLDVVLVLDMSPSMGDARDPDSKICQSIASINETIHMLMTLNENNRVAVLAFSSQVAMLMPLDHYPTRDKLQELYGANEYLTCEYIGLAYDTYPLTKVNVFTGDWFYTNLGGNDFCFIKGSNDWGQYDEHCLGGYTNMDGGFWAGLNVLAGADTVMDMNGVRISRKPAFIFLGDGDPNVIMINKAGVTSRSWWDPIDPLTSTHGSNVNVIGGNSNYYDYPATILSTMMRASLMRNVAERHYIYEASGCENESEIGLGFFTIGMSLGDMLSSNRGGNANKFGTVSPEQHEKIAKAVMDPAHYFYAGDGSLDPSLGINWAYHGWRWLMNRENNSFNYSGDFSVNGRDGWVYYVQPSMSQIHYERIPEGGITQCGITVTMDDVAKYMNTSYTDRFFDAQTASDIYPVLTELIQWLIGPAFMPVNQAEYMPVVGDIEYTDPIGEHMSVDNVTDVVLFGERYSVEESGVEEEDGVTKTHYKITAPYGGAVGTWKTVLNEGYGAWMDHDLVMFNTDDIKIWVEDDGEEETLHVCFPAAALPVQVAAIEVTFGEEYEKGYKMEHTVDLDTVWSKPLRVVYSVSLDEGIVDEDGLLVETDDISGYVAEHSVTDNGTVWTYFLSNYYSGGDGDPETLFNISDDNLFYQNNHGSGVADAGKLENITETASVYRVSDRNDLMLTMSLGNNGRLFAANPAVMDLTAPATGGSGTWLIWLIGFILLDMGGIMMALRYYKRKA